MEGKLDDLSGTGVVLKAVDKRHHRGTKEGRIDLEVENCLKTRKSGDCWENSRVWRNLEPSKDV